MIFHLVASVSHDIISSPMGLKTFLSCFPDIDNKHIATLLKLELKKNVKMFRNV